MKEFTDNTYAQGSFFWNYLIRNKEIKINGKKTGENVFLAAGDKVAYYLPSEKEKKSAFYPVYEDENVLVIDKESGVNSEAVFAALSRERKCFFIHRLDRNTAGLLIFALRTEAAVWLEKAFRERRVEKIYHAGAYIRRPRSGCGKNCDGIRGSETGKGIYESKNRSAYGQDASDPRPPRLYRLPRRGGYEIRLFRRKSAFRAHPTVPRSQEPASCCGRGARLFEG